MSASNNVLKRGIRWNSAAAMNVEAQKRTFFLYLDLLCPCRQYPALTTKKILSKVSQHNESLPGRQGEIRSCARHCEAPISLGEYNIDGYTNLTGRIITNPSKSSTNLGPPYITPGPSIRQWLQQPPLFWCYWEGHTATWDNVTTSILERKRPPLNSLVISNWQRLPPLLLRHRNRLHREWWRICWTWSGYHHQQRVQLWW